jgi:cytochrome c oxidase subunit 4
MSHENGHAGHHEEGHIIPPSTLVLVWLTLLALTGLTITAAGVHLGSGNVVVAILIATVKVFLVVSWFMHMKYESKLFKVFLSLCLVVLAIVIALTFMDTTLW